MKYFKKLNLYKAANVTFNPEVMEARSYSWWIFVKMINGKVVFNSFPYSNTTARHQRKVRALLRDLGIEIDLEIQAPGGLQNLESAVNYYENQIDALYLEMKKPRSQKAKNSERQSAIDLYFIKQSAVLRLMKQKKRA